MPIDPILILSETPINSAKITWILQSEWTILILSWTLVDRQRHLHPSHKTIYTAPVKDTCNLHGP